MSARASFLVVALILAACGPEDESQRQPAASGTPGSISFLHLNDTYRVGAVEDGGRGGFGRVTTIIRGLQGQGHTVRLRDGPGKSDSGISGFLA